MRRYVLAFLVCAAVLPGCKGMGGLGHLGSGLGHAVSGLGHAAGAIGHVAGHAALPVARAVGHAAPVVARTTAYAVEAAAEAAAIAPDVTVVQEQPADPVPDDAPGAPDDLCLDCPDAGNCNSCPQYQ